MGISAWEVGDVSVGVWDKLIVTEKAVYHHNTKQINLLVLGNVVVFWNA